MITTAVAKGEKSHAAAEIAMTTVLGTVGRIVHGAHIATSIMIPALALSFDTTIARAKQDPERSDHEP